MSTVPVTPQRPWPGVAANGSLFVVALGFLGISIGLVVMAIARNAPTGLLVATVAFLVGTGAFCVWTGAAVFYQARSGRRPLGGRSVVLAPPLVMRVAMVVIAVSIGIITVGAFTVAPSTLFVFGLASVAMALITARFLVFRFEANDWGITSTGPFTTVRIPWNALRSLEPRGDSAFTQRVQVVTEQGRKPRLWILDPRFPVSRDSARLLVAALDAVRQSASSPDE
jgi:hypothetical protein